MNHLTTLYDEVINMAEISKMYAEVEWAIYGLIDLHSFYNMVDQVRVDKARLQRVQKIMGTGTEMADESTDDVSSLFYVS